MVNRCKQVTGHVYTYTGSPARIHGYVHKCAGKFNPVKVNAPHTTCADANASVIATEAECLKAAILLSIDEQFTGRIVETTQLPYCGYYTEPRNEYDKYAYAGSYYTFETSGMKEYEGDYSCAHPDATCVCNKGTELRATTTHPSQANAKCQFSTQHINRAQRTENHLRIPQRQGPVGTQYR